MFKKFTNGCVKLVQRFLPDAFVFCIILTIVVFIAAMPVAGINSCCRRYTTSGCRLLGHEHLESVSILNADGSCTGTW